MAQTFSLMKNENSKNIYNDYKSGIFYNTINKFMDNSSKLKMKIQKGIDYFNTSFILLILSLIDSSFSKVLSSVK